MFKVLDETSVAIIGAGPSGLALAIELGSRSIPCVVIERNDRVGYAPRAKTTNLRTRAHLRRWGIADKLAAASPFGIDYPTDVVFVTRLAGEQVARFPWAFRCNPARDPRYPEHSQWIPQYKLEAVLLEHARSLPTVRFHFNNGFESFTQDGAGVNICLRGEDGVERRLQARYLVGADGARSQVREQIGAKMKGAYGLSRNYNTIFEAPGLAEAHKHGRGIMFWQLNQEVPSMLGPMDRGDLWFFMPTGVPEGVSYTPTEIGDLIRRSTGIDVPYRVLSSDEWTASRLLADRYSVGRVFLVGDACHLHPPFGGYGMNMGVADSVDLGWKIAAVLQGWGGPSLLDTYELERRPAHNYVMDEAEANHALSPNQLAWDGIEDQTVEGAEIRQSVCKLSLAKKTSEFYGLGVILGYRYLDSPIIIDDGTQAGWLPNRDYLPSNAPGCLAPHLWLSDGRSLYDLFGKGFTLIVAAGKGNPDCLIAQSEADNAGIPLEVIALENEEIGELYESPLTVIRPDQIVAWRGSAWPSNLLKTISGERAPTFASISSSTL